MGFPSGHFTMSARIPFYIDTLRRGLGPTIALGLFAWIFNDMTSVFFIAVGTIVILWMTIGIRSTVEELAVEFANILVTYAFIATYMWTVPKDTTRIGPFRAALEFLLYYVFQDIWFYAMHYDMHNGCWKFARRIHTWHHHIQTDCFMKAFYNHPLEPLLLAAPSLLFGHFVLRIMSWFGIFALGSRTTLLMWIPIAQFFIMWAHTGLNISWLPDTSPHARHHKRVKGNYSFLLDPVLGTKLKGVEADQIHNDLASLLKTE